MSEPVFASRSPRLGLPLLFAGQTQKEAFVNESLVRLDALVSCAIEATSPTPPAAPQDGQCWLVADGASGAWAGRAGAIAFFQQGQWLFQLPQDGLQVLDRSTGQIINYSGAWRVAAKPGLPTGGTTVDTQARTAIAAIIDSLAAAGILATQ